MALQNVRCNVLRYCDESLQLTLNSCRMFEGCVVVLVRAHIESEVRNV